MRCLNAPGALNALEAKIVESTPAGAVHILVVNAGDGRLVRAVREKSGGAHVSAVSLNPEFGRYLDDIPNVGTSPWDLEWYEQQVAAYGPFDYVVLYQLQEFWQGGLDQLSRLLALAKPGALVWTSFLNAQSIAAVGRYFPPVRLGAATLADPTRARSNLDFASFVDFANFTGNRLIEVWGMLDAKAHEYCQSQPKEPVQWELRPGVNVTVASIADAFLWGASVVGIGFQIKGGESSIQPKVSGSKASTALLQVLLEPYPDIQGRELALFIARREVELWQQQPNDQKLGPLAEFFLQHIGESELPKRVLLVGSGWGGDLLTLKRHRPAWDWVGAEPSAEKAALGKPLLEAAGLQAVTFDPEGTLPFADREFDLVLSLGHFSTIYEPAARHLSKELLRVAKAEIYHLEDARGPDVSLQLKQYSLQNVYAEHGKQATLQPVLVQGKPSGRYLLKVSAS